MLEANIYTGTCEYCGREEAVIAASIEDADFFVTKECSCQESEEADKMRHMHELLNDLIGEGAPECGFEAVQRDAYAQIVRLAMFVVTGTIKQITLSIDNTKVSIKNSNGKLSAIRTRSVVQGGQIE